MDISEHFLDLQNPGSAETHVSLNFYGFENDRLSR